MATYQYHNTLSFLIPHADPLHLSFQPFLNKEGTLKFEDGSGTDLVSGQKMADSNHIYEHPLVAVEFDTFWNQYDYVASPNPTQTQMQTLGLLVAPVLGFYHRFLRFSLRFLLLMLMDIPSTFNFLTQLTELGCGFLLLGYVSRIFNLLGLLLIFLCCLRFLRSPLLSKDEKSSRDENLKEETENNNISGSNWREENLEDEVFDIMSLRSLVKAERQRFNAACAEIEKERGAAASAAEEAMAMILRLQSEKSAVEIQAKQFRRVVEQKQEYDLEVIESLQWTVEQVESQKNLLERQLGVLRERLRDYINEYEIQKQLQEQDQEQVQVQEYEPENEHETEQGTASDVDFHPEDGVGRDRDDEVDRVRDDDVDSGSGYLNFSVEYDDVDAASSQSPSPSHTPQHFVDEIATQEYRFKVGSVRNFKFTEITSLLFQDMKMETPLLLPSCQMSLLQWNATRYGNGASIFTTSNAAARKFQTEVELDGLAYMSQPLFHCPLFISSWPSFVGDFNFDGIAEIQFYTRLRCCQTMD
ncbi:unnamed protein product [Sphenostylis stenocarpa]|uniref:GTD-binding domain-containing protein n=1 Tax=Sphenostylis stenocarpa TaxID=92480 RepID=A0AA86SMF0_9FABA|nr:unnamed protein product [Sphenostylis stenocarpa]